MIKKLVTAFALCAAGTAAMAQMSPVGLWRTIDDDGKTEKSQVRITEQGGVLTGVIEKITDPTKQDSKCDECTDDRKGKPAIGMQIIRGVKQDADDKELWTGGQILDPNNGKIYKTRLKPIEGGKKMEMRGYIGFLYRTQVWVRAE